MKKSRKRLALNTEIIARLTPGLVVGGRIVDTQTNEDCTGSLQSYCSCTDTFPGTTADVTHFFCPR
jgi:hypothetical protein